MKNFKKPLLGIALVLVCLPAWSQSLRSQLRNANTQYEAKAYFQAIESYSKILKGYPSDEEALSKIADCYWHVNQMENAFKSYTTLIQKGRYEPKDLLTFGHVLKALGRYEEAKRYYSDYAKTDATVGNHFATTCDFARYQQSQPGEFSVTEERVNSSAADFSPVFWGDQVVFATQRTDVQRPAGWDGSSQSILLVSRLGADGYLAPPVNMSTRPAIGPVSYASNGRYVAYTMNSFVNGVRQIPSAGAEMRLVTAEVTAGGSWAGERNFPFNSKKNNTGYPCFTADGGALFFASDEGTGGYGGYDLYVSYRKDNGWTKPVNLGPTVNTPGNEIAPFFDGNNLFFASDWHPGLGGMDIFRADQQNGQWTKVTNLATPVNSSFDDYSFIFDGGKNTGYMVSNRNGSRGGEDIFRVTRGMATSQPVTGTGLILRVVHALDGSPVAGASIDLSACNPNFTRTIVTTNAAGIYQLPHGASTNCDITITKDGYKEEQVSLYGATAGGNREVEIMLTRRGEDYFGYVFNGQSQMPLAGVAVAALNMATGAVARAYSNQQGQIAVSLAANATYQVTYSAQGFMDVVNTVNTFNPQNRNVLGNQQMFPSGSSSSGTNIEPGTGLLPPPPPPPPSGGFSVQISAMNGVPDMAGFSRKVGSTGNVYNVFADNKYKVRVGPYATRAQAEQARNALKAKGFAGAYVVTESGGTTTPNNNNPGNTVGPNIPAAPTGNFLIQLGAYRNPGSFNPGIVASMGPIIDFRKNDLTLKLLSGFMTAQEARNMLPRVRSAGFPSAFVVEMRNGGVSAVPER